MMSHSVEVTNWFSSHSSEVLDAKNPLLNKTETQKSITGHENCYYFHFWFAKYKSTHLCIRYYIDLIDFPILWFEIENWNRSLYMLGKEFFFEKNMPKCVYFNLLELS